MRLASHAVEAAISFQLYFRGGICPDPPFICCFASANNQCFITFPAICRKAKTKWLLTGACIYLTSKLNTCRIMKKLSLLFLSLLLLLGQDVVAQRKTKIDKKEEISKHWTDTLYLGLKWRSVGPAVTSGRISDLAVHPTDKSTYYVATASGGVWKTSNNGTTYEPIFDNEGSYSIGCVTLDPSNPNVVWVGTGENNNQRSVGYGDGVYKSEDGGRSWKNMGLKNSEHIAKIIVDPTNSDVVWVAAMGPLWSAGGDRGLYKTTDGGISWKQVLTNEKGESLLDANTGVVDVVMDPRNPNVLYVAAFQRRRHVYTYVGGGPGSTIYKTKDGGKTWQKADKGLPDVELGRIGLAISPADPEVIYAIVEAAQGKSGFFKSTNRAASWEKQSNHSTSGNYYCEIFCHPHNPDIVYSMDVFNQVSYDGGKTWMNLGEQYKHVDNHALWIDPDDTDHLISGCDGGLYESYDHGKTWHFKANLPVTQFYKVAVDNSQPFYYIYGGTQDNFSLGGPSRTRNGHGIANSDWFVTQLGDGFESAIDPENPNIVYAQSQYGGLTRYDRVSGENLSIQPQPREGEEAYRWNWDAPLSVSKHKSSRIYFAANKLFRSDDRGDTWEVISPDLTRQIDRNQLPVMGRIQSIDAVAKNAATSPYGNIVAFAESPLNENLLYVGTDDGLVQITDDGGKTWHKVASFPGVPDTTYVNMLLASQHDENVVYACFNNHKRGDFKPYVLKSSDKGRTWININGNLPERGSSYCIAEDHVKSELLFVGTEFSCFFTPDGGQHWKKLGQGLPTIAVRDMAIQQQADDLVLATFGRGFYVLDDYSPLREISSDMLQEKGKILPIKPGLLYTEARPLGYATGKGFQGHSFYTAPNPPVGATFTYYIKDEIKTLKQKRQKWEKEQIKADKPIRYPTYEELEAELTEEAPYLLFTIHNRWGEMVRQLKTSVSKGINRITWDGRYPSKEPVSLQGAEPLPWQSPEGGALAMPGNYFVTMTLVHNEQHEQLGQANFQILPLGSVTLQASERKVLDDYALEAAELERAFQGASRALNELDNRLKHIEKALIAIGSPLEMSDALKMLKEEVRMLRKSFYGDNTAAAIDQPAPPSLMQRIYGMAYDIWTSTSAPTNTMKEQKRIAGEIFKKDLTTLRRLIEVDLKQLEDKLEAAKAPYTPGRLPRWE